MNTTQATPQSVLEETDLFGVTARVEVKSVASKQPTFHRRSTPAANSSKEKQCEEGDDFESDAPIEIDFENISVGDTQETFVAKRMFARLIADLSGEASLTPPDLFGHINDDREQRKQDALIWMYDLNPDGSLMSFQWVCDEIGLDAEMIKRITARNVRNDLKGILKLLSSMVSPEYANACELDLQDYVNLSGWNLN